MGKKNFNGTLSNLTTLENGRYIIRDKKHIAHFMNHHFQKWALYIITHCVREIYMNDKNAGTFYIGSIDFELGNRPQKRFCRKRSHFKKRNGSRK